MNDDLAKWYDLFSRELDRWMEKIHKMEKPKSADVLKAFKFATEYADAAINELELRRNKLEESVGSSSADVVCSTKNV